MRRLVAALAALVLILALAGCGGGGSSSSSTSSTDSSSSSSQAAAAPAPSGEAGSYSSDKSPTETVDFAPLPANKSLTPTSVAEALRNGEPMLILFFDSKQKVTDDQRAEVDAVVKKYRGMIQLLAFDLAKGRTTKGAKDDESQKAALMAGELKVGYTPYIVIVDKNGLQVARFSGFVDRQTLEREVLRATD